MIKTQEPWGILGVGTGLLKSLLGKVSLVVFVWHVDLEITLFLHLNFSKLANFVKSMTQKPIKTMFC